MFVMVSNALGVAKVACLPVTLLLLTGAVGCTGKTPNNASVAALRIASTQPSFKRQLAEAKDLFYLAVTGDHQALPDAQKILRQLGGADSPDPEVVAYTGAADLLQANHSDSVFEKVRLAREGLDLQDKAVKDAPDNLEVRFLRGVTDYQLPDFLGRHEIGVQDLDFVAHVAEDAVRAGRLDKRAASAALVYHGKALEAKYQIPQAVAAWQAAVRISPDSPGGIDAAKHLAEHGQPPIRTASGM
jgi:tetratricopeptide (TPR) repeat protein